MITSTSTPAELAATMRRAYFDDLPRDLDDYLTLIPTDDDSRPLRDRLIIALDFDINDLLHNSNLSDLIPDAADLDDDAYLALETRLLDDDNYIPILADLIIADLD